MISSSGYLTVNIHIAREFGLDAAALLAELASTQLYWMEKDQLDEDGMFFETSEQIEERTTLSRYKQANAVKALEDAGIVFTKRKGVPAKRYFSLNTANITQLICNKMSKNLTTRFQKIKQQDVKKFDTNKKREQEKKTRKDINNIVAGSSLSDPVKETVNDFLAYRDEMKKPFKSERGIKTLVKEIERQEQAHGSAAVLYVIRQTMSNGWQGLFWDKIPQRDEPRGADAYYELAKESMTDGTF